MNADTDDQGTAAFYSVITDTAMHWRHELRPLEAMVMILQDRIYDQYWGRCLVGSGHQEGVGHVSAVIR